MMSYYKFHRLVTYLKNIDSLAIAFSGGVDSTFLLHIAREYIKYRIIAITSISVIHKKKDIEDAKSIAQDLGIKHFIIDSQELLLPEFTTNNKDRCYYCKKNLFKKMVEIAEKEGISYVAHAANQDDVQDYRPGHRAAKEYGIISPLVYAGLNKQDIRNIAMDMGIKIWNKPSSPCLATRIPYGQKITLKRLDMVEKAENLLQDMGCKDVRVRHYGDMAKIEVSESDIRKVIEMRKDILKEFKQIGFLFVSLDIEGFMSGKLNKMIREDN